MSGFARTRSIDRDWHPVEPEVLLPTQLSEGLDQWWTPERRLLAAVLTEAVNCFLRDPHSGISRNRRLRAEAEKWIMSTDRDWFCSFENVCDVLGIDPDYLRRGLQRSDERWQGRAPEVRSAGFSTAEVRHNCEAHGHVHERNRTDRPSAGSPLEEPPCKVVDIRGGSGFVQCASARQLR